ncbi:Inactive leucine-rich repeat receptor serine/threonine-protein kinase [Spatholobus suberectus]|nr:Inactive leucine-rich repeat receptor serine/threonine-protein kinase [Spatholobus suberectus]
MSSFFFLSRCFVSCCLNLLDQKTIPEHFSHSNLHRRSRRASMARRKRRVHVARGQRLLQRKSEKASAGTLQPNRHPGFEDLEPFGPTPSPEFQRKLTLRPNPRPLRLDQPQIDFPQRQQLLRRVPRLRRAPPPRQGRRPIRKQNLRRHPGLAAEAPATLRPLPARQRVHRTHPGFQPNQPQVPERLQQPALRRDSGDPRIDPIQRVVVFRQPGALRGTDPPGVQNAAAVDKPWLSDDTGRDDDATTTSSTSSNRTKLMKIIGGSVGGVALAVVCMVAVWAISKRRRKRVGSGTRSKGGADVAEGEAGAAGSAGGGERDNKQEGFAWEGEGLGKLVFCGGGDREMSYSLEDLLKASAETLGRGIMGSTYKAVMESGFIVTVKRLKDARYPGLEEFRAHIQVLGRLTHPNLVPLRAYFQAKEERLLVYDYFPNGSLFSLIHGSKTSGGGKPLHWTSCLKIAEDVATGLLYIHQNPGLTHGNLKSSNVLLGSDFESCLTDYGLTVFLNPESVDEPSATSLFYRAPECRNFQRSQTQPADVYSFGVLLLELLTGKTPFQDLVQTYGSDIPRWVRSVREEETESGDDPTSGTEASEEKLQALLNIAMACVSLVPGEQAYNERGFKDDKRSKRGGSCLI